MRNKPKKFRSIERRKSRDGFLLILPWFAGVLLFFFLPIAQSVWYSFSKVSLEATGIRTLFQGFANYTYILNIDPQYTGNLFGSVTQILYSVPIILIISLILAIVLNSRFRGRLFFRGLFFLPVIIATGVVIELVFTCLGGATDASLAGAGAFARKSGSMTGSMIDFDVLLTQLQLPDRVVSVMSSVIGGIFDLIWSCGIQVVLFVAGLQSIPPQLYEVSRVEGASKWEEFWFITFPQLHRVLFLVIVFTSIELFTAKSNPVISQAYGLMNTMQYDIPSAMLWVYFAVVGAVLGLIMLVYGRLSKKWD